MQGFYDAPEHSHIPWEGEKKKVTIPEYVVCRKKTQPCVIKGPQLDLLCIAVFWFILCSDTKSYILNLRKQGEESLPWIQNQIL